MLLLKIVPTFVLWAYFQVQEINTQLEAFELEVEQAQVEHLAAPMKVPLEKANKPAVKFSIAANGEIRKDNKPLAAEQRDAFLKELDKDNQIKIQVDEEAPQQAVIDLLNELITHGHGSVTFEEAVEPQP